MRHEPWNLHSFCSETDKECFYDRVNNCYFTVQVLNNEFLESHGQYTHTHTHTQNTYVHTYIHTYIHTLRTHTYEARLETLEKANVSHLTQVLQHMIDAFFMCEVNDD